MKSAHENNRLFRKLLRRDYDAFKAHLLRLDRESRHMRFGHAVSDQFIQTYVDATSTLGGVVHGCFIDGVLRAAAELRPGGGLAPRMAEAAFSVEAGYQNDGIGSALLSRLLLSARNRRIDRIVMYCLLENGRMRAVAQKHRAVLNVADGEIVGEVAPARVSALSLMREAMWDTSAIIEDALETQHRRLANRA